MERIVVLDRVHERHPDVEPADAAAAWDNCLISMPEALEENPERYIGIGIDDKGRLLELVAVRKPGGLWLIIHAQTPPQHDIMRRLGFTRRKQ